MAKNAKKSSNGTKKNVVKNVENVVNEALAKVHFVSAERLNGVKTSELDLEESTVANFTAKLHSCKDFENVNVTKCVRCAKGGQYAGWVLYQLNGDESKWYATKHFTKDVADFAKEKETRTESETRTRRRFNSVEDFDNAIKELEEKKAAFIAQKETQAMEKATQALASLTPEQKKALAKMLK